MAPASKRAIRDSDDEGLGQLTVSTKSLLPLDRGGVRVCGPCPRLLPPREGDRACWDGD